jgi:Tol biopolymer transport system component
MAAVLLALALGALLRVAPALAAGHSLVTLDLDSGATRTLARSRLGWEALRPTPDGRSLLVIRDAASGPGRRVTRVRRRIDLVSGGQTRLPVTREGAGSFSPDGTRVFAQTSRVEAGEMVLRTLAGRPLVRLRPRSGGGFMGATWSPDSRLLAVEDPLDADALEGRQTHFRVRLVDTRTGRILGARNVTGGQPVLGAQSFAPAGDRLVMSVMRSTGVVFDGFTAILDLRTGALARIAPEHGGFTLPAWSPDGRHIALRRASGGVAVLDAATGATERIIPTPDAIADGPRWSPDGTRLAYALVPPELFCLACFFSPDGPPSIRTEAGLAVADVTTGTARVLVAPGTRNVHAAVWTRDGRGLIADIEDVRRAGRPAAPRRDPGAGARSRARAAGAAPRAARL